MSCQYRILYSLFVILFLINTIYASQRATQYLEKTRYTSLGHARIAIVGAGAVGTTIAYAIMLKNIASEIILVDATPARCRGEVLDLSDAISATSTAHIRQGNLQDAGLADIIIITSGSRRKADQSRLDLIKINHSIISSIITSMAPINPKAIIIMVTNPVDIMTYFAQHYAHIAQNQIFGSGTYLDTLRLRGLLAEQLKISEQSIQAYILGEHGDSQCAIWSSANIAGIPLKDFPGMTREELQRLALKAKQKGHEIIELKESTFYGIGTCIADMCESIIFNQRRVFPVSIFLEEYGTCLSMPAVIGENGVEHILHVQLDDQEKSLLKNSAQMLSSIISDFSFNMVKAP